MATVCDHLSPTSGAHYLYRIDPYCPRPLRPRDSGTQPTNYSPLSHVATNGQLGFALPRELLDAFSESHDQFSQSDIAHIA